MNRPYDSENDLQELHDGSVRDREISLGTSMILGIFFVLALLCAIFFGFGYSMGRRSAQPIANTLEAPTTSDSTDSKPTPGSVANRAVQQSPHTEESDAAYVGDSDSTPAAATPLSEGTTRTVTSTLRSDSSAQPVANSGVKAVSMPRPAAAAGSAPVAVAVPGLGSAIVQIAAVSHQEDADVLVNALKKRGYSVNIRHEPQDKLLHVQIGPYASKKDAEVMRQRLTADGYNAIVK